MSLEDLTGVVTGYGESAYRARQIRQWVLNGQDYAHMSNVPKKLLEVLKNAYRCFDMSISSVLIEDKSSVKKYLYLTLDDIIVEGVNLPYLHGNAQCVSTQAGCRMGCSFCVSGKNGRIRDLSAGEMLSQVVLASRDTETRTSNIVLMGSGEPLDNYTEVVAFIDIVQRELNISHRSITLSTCGIVDGIYQMISDNLNINLAVSLHAPTHEMRLQMMPIEAAYPIHEVVRAASAYAEASRRRVTYEYCVIEGTNDTTDCANALKGLLGSSNCLINLIDLNDPLKPNSKGAAVRFQTLLTDRNLNVTIRRSLGSSINAACGQLSSGYINK